MNRSRAVRKSRYDIFYSIVNEDETWSKPTNIGYPISTPDDDVHFVMSASGKHGYYSSFREDGEGEKDGDDDFKHDEPEIDDDDDDEEIDEMMSLRMMSSRLCCLI